MVNQCSSGTISAVGTLPLLDLAAAEADLEAGADGAAPESSWRHVTLELQEGRAGRLAHAMESAVAGAVVMGESWEVPGAGGKRQAGSEADQKQQQQQRQQQAAGDVGLEAGGIAAAAGTAAPDAAVAQAAASSADGTPQQQQPQQQLQPPPHQQQQDGDLGHSGRLAALRSTTLTLRLSYRPLRQPPSSLLSAAQQRQAAAAALASRKSLRASRTFIRLLSMRQPSSLEPGGDAAGSERKQQQGAGPAGVVQEGVPLEVPLVAMPRHLHSYGHGGKSAVPVLQLPLPPQFDLPSPCRAAVSPLVCLPACLQPSWVLRCRCLVTGNGRRF